MRLYSANRCLECLDQQGSSLEARFHLRKGETESRLGLFTRTECKPGDVLLSIPYDSWIFTKEQGEIARRGLRSQLLDLKYMAHPSLHIQYYTRVFPPETFRNYPLCWPEDGELASRLANSMSWRRMLQQQAEIQDELTQSVNDANVQKEDALWASLVAHYCAVAMENGSTMLCPLLDLAPHASRGAVAQLRQ